jgi:hypothetical protein
LEYFVATVRRLAPGALLVTALAVATAACGSSGSTPSSAASLRAQAVSDPLAGWSVQRIEKQSQEDTLAAPYVRVTGSASDSGHRVAFDLTMVAGRGCRGTMTEQGLGSFTLISNGKTVWVKPDAAFYRSVAAEDPQVVQAEPLLAGKYLEDPAGTGLGSLASTCSLRGLLGSASPSSADTSFARAGTAVIDGQRALKFTSAKEHGYVYVTDTAKPEVLQMATSESGGGSLSFTYYATAPAITPPPASEVLDGSQYGF